jgi:hypothetical protein
MDGDQDTIGMTTLELRDGDELHCDLSHHIAHEPDDDAAFLDWIEANAAICTDAEMKRAMDATAYLLRPRADVRSVLTWIRHAQIRAAFRAAMKTRCRQRAVGLAADKSAEYLIDGAKVTERTVENALKPLARRRQQKKKVCSAYLFR